MQVKIKLLEGGIMPTKKSKGAAAFDCYARETITIAGDDPTLIGLGFALEIPEGYHAEIVPRSSIGLCTRLRQPNSVGIIDSDYRGEVKAMYEVRAETRYSTDRYALFYTPVEINKGDRIAQMLIKRNEDVEFLEVDELSDTERGENGFGSTGRNEFK